MAFELTFYPRVEGPDGTHAKCTGCGNPAKQLLKLGPFNDRGNQVFIPICKRCVPGLCDVLARPPKRADVAVKLDRSVNA